MVGWAVGPNVIVIAYTVFNDSSLPIQDLEDAYVADSLCTRRAINCHSKYYPIYYRLSSSSSLYVYASPIR